MSYYRADLPPNPIQVLLNKLETAEADNLAPEQIPPTDIPSLDQFLAEEDVLRECRSENELLVQYICRPNVISQLVDKTFDIPTMPPDCAPNGRPLLSASHEKVSPTLQQDRERRMKFAYVASELLTSDNKSISDAIVENDHVMQRIFAFLQQSNPGKLNSIVAVQFSKIIVNLLKMRNPKVLEQMDKTDSNFVTNVLKHMDSLPIAELVVRLLDNPGPEPAYGPSPGVKRPTDEALQLLSRCDLLDGLAACFVKASCGDLTNPASGIASQDLDIPVESDNVDVELSAEEDSQRRRLKEETMANVSMTILGLTERMLQFPELGVRIPEKLSPYSSPAVIARILDAGLYANCSGNPNKKTPLTEDGLDEDVERIEAFSKGNTSALVHSLGLAADLLTTESNVLRDEDDDMPHGVLNHAAGIPERAGGMGFGRTPFSGKGIGPSISAHPVSEALNENGEAVEKPCALPELLDKKAGDPIVETNLLQAELAIRFARLSQMFDDGDTMGELSPSGRAKPLGSLRLKLAEFFVACMKKGSQDTVDQINDLGVPRKLLDLFARYPWSSMLHGVVTKAIVYSLEDTEVGRPARQAWLKAGLIPWVMESWAKNAEREKTERGSSAGYMGHLIRIGTALKGYIEENRNEPNADLPEHSEIDSFDAFSDRVLAPAHHREATPLCEDRPDSDEEEARDVLEMGGINIVEGLTPESAVRDPMNLKYAAFVADNVIDDDEEIKTVEVDDLEHFGADDEDDLSARAIDHDIPPLLREELSKGRKEDIKDVSGRGRADATSSSGYRPHVGPVDYSRVHVAEQTDELKGVIDTVDSSSDEEGSYVAFVDDQRETENVRSITEKLDGVKIGADASDSSLAGAVTEIDDEPGPIGSVAPLLPSLASNVVSISDDDMDSSDEEYEAWVDAPNPPASSSSAGPASGRETTARSAAEVEASRKVG